VSDALRLQSNRRSDPTSSSNAGSLSTEVTPTRSLVASTDALQIEDAFVSSSLNGVSKPIVGVRGALAISISKETPTASTLTSIPSPTIVEVTDSYSKPTASNQVNSTGIDTSSITVPTTSADVASAMPAPQRAPASTDNAENQLDASALSVTTAQQALAPSDNAETQPDTPVITSSQLVKQEVLADDIELTDASNLPSGVPSEAPRGEPDAMVLVAETREDTDWRSLPFAFYDVLTDAFEILESVALDEPRLICRLCYDT
jgi:hypothetical protein